MLIDVCGRTSITEYSSCLFNISYIPVVGVPFSMFQKYRLDQELIQTTEIANKIEVLSVRHEYLMADMVRRLFTVALVVAGVALNILSLDSGIVLAIVFLMLAQRSSNEITLNSQVIHQLRESVQV